MTRFIMSLDEAAWLVIESTVLATPGDVLITKMPTINISDLAAVMISEQAPRYGLRPTDIRVVDIGPKPGEKLYEELMNDEETRRSVELERYFVVRPAMLSDPRDDYGGQAGKTVTRPYNSANEQPLSVGELTQFLHEKGLIEQS